MRTISAFACINSDRRQSFPQLLDKLVHGKCRFAGKGCRRLKSKGRGLRPFLQILLIFGVVALDLPLQFECRQLGSDVVGGAVLRCCADNWRSTTLKTTSIMPYRGSNTIWRETIVKRNDMWRENVIMIVLLYFAQVSNMCFCIHQFLSPPTLTAYH